MRTFKICLVGNYGVGKTSTIERYVSNIFSEVYVTSIGLNVSTKKLLVGTQEVKMVIWDLAGKDSLSNIDYAYLRGADAILFVADGTRAETLSVIIQLRTEILENMGPIIHSLLINKYDLKDIWEINETQIEEMRATGDRVYLTSAKDGVLVNEAFAGVAEQLLTKEVKESYI